MMTRPTTWIEQFPGLLRLPVDTRSGLTASTAVITLPAGSRIYGPGQSPQNYLLLIDGTVRVQQVSDGGREIVLYRVSAGESCALTTACLMGYEDYPAEAIAETDVRAAAVPRSIFDDLIARSPEFRRFVFTAFSVRITSLLQIIDDVAFSRMDIRLAQKLLELSRGADTVPATHQQVASELGTAREVVSRMLAEFQRRHWVTVGRGQLEITNRVALERLAREQ